MSPQKKQIPRTANRTDSDESVAFAQIILAQSLLQQALVDLAESDRQRLLLVLVFDQRADVLQQALVELGEVRVDLTGAVPNSSLPLTSVSLVSSAIFASLRIT